MPAKPVENQTVNDFLTLFGSYSFIHLDIPTRKKLVLNELAKIEEEERKKALDLRQKLIISDAKFLTDLVPKDGSPENVKLISMLQEAYNNGRWPREYDLKLQLVQVNE